MQPQWFRQGQGFLVVYSIVNKKSFSEVSTLRQKIERVKEGSKIAMVLVRFSSQFLHMFIYYTSPELSLKKFSSHYLNIILIIVYF